MDTLNDLSVDAAAAAEKKVQLDALGRLIDQTASEALNCMEWGILGNDDEYAGHKRPAVIGLFPKAHAALARGDIEEAEQLWVTAKAVLADAQISAKSYRVVCHWCLTGLLATLISSALAFWVVFIVWMQMDSVELMKASFFAGWVGAFLKSLYYLQRHAGRGELRPRWNVYFIVAPWVGIFLGWIIWLLVWTLLAIGVQGETVEPNWMVISFLAAFAGFKWEWALDWMQDTATRTRGRFSGKAEPAPAPVPALPASSSSSSGSSGSSRGFPNSSMSSA